MSFSKAATRALVALSVDDESSFFSGVARFEGLTRAVIDCKKDEAEVGVVGCSGAELVVRVALSLSSSPPPAALAVDKEAIKAGERGIVVDRL